MNEPEIKRIVEETVETMLTKYGFDVTSPIEMQEDLAWVRRYRKACERIGGRVVLTVVTIATGSVVALVYQAFRSKAG